MPFTKANSVIWYPQQVNADEFLVSEPIDIPVELLISGAINIPASLSMTFLLFFANLAATNFGGVGPLFQIDASETTDDDSGWIPFQRITIPRTEAGIDADAGAVTAGDGLITSASANQNDVSNNGWIFLNDPDIGKWEWLRVRDVVNNTAYHLVDKAGFDHPANTPIHSHAFVIPLNIGVEMFKRVRLTFMSTHCTPAQNAAVAAKLCTQVILNA